MALPIIYKGAGSMSHELREFVQTRINKEREACNFRPDRDFSEVLKDLQAAKQGKWKEALKAAIGDSDFNESYDLAIDIPDGFWDKIIGYDSSLNNVRVEFTSAQTISSNELTLGTNGEDIWRPGVEGVDPGETVTADTAQRTFVPEELICIVALTDKVLEDNIEHGDLQSHLMNMIMAATANEFAHFAWNGFKVGSGNSERGSCTGCFDGFIKQIADGGHVVDANVTFSDRYVDLDASSNDKHVALNKLMPEKYDLERMQLLSPRTLVTDARGILGVQRLTPLGDMTTLRGFRELPVYDGLVWVPTPKLRTNYVVSMTKRATSPGATQLNGISKARATSSIVDAITNFGNTDKVVIGATSAAATAFQLNAEYRSVSGVPSGSTLTWNSALGYDHADNEHVVEAESATTPVVNGCAQALLDWQNLVIYSHRALRVEPFREPRKRQTSFVLTCSWVPVVLNPDATGLIKNLLAR